MKKWILVAIITLFALAIVRLVVTTTNAVDTDVQNYIKGLNYKLTARVDSAVVTNESKGIGFLFCSVTSGRFDPSVENVLADHLKEHNRLRVMFPTRNGFKVFLGGIRKFAPSDSVIIDSDIDRFAVFRGSESIWESRVSYTTVGKVSFAFWIPD
ncbi:MAG TPA: hypothetical protein VEW65_03025 [Chryseolinea sp.]|nr:hypothetical protein [Chryseolinea sp.]